MTSRLSIVLSIALATALSGVAIAQPNPTPVPNEPGPMGPGIGAPRSAPPPHASIQLTPQEMEALKDVESENDRFVQAAKDHDARLRMIARREFDTRTAETEKRYAIRIAHTETDRKKRHTDTIALLVKFLAEHPAHEQYTPDKMYQLAELYLDKADSDVEERLAAQEAANIAPTPDQVVVADYTPATDLWQKILEKFPNYRQTPATLYLLAYYGKSKDDRKSLELFLSLTCANHYKWSDAAPPLPTRAEALKRAESKELRDPYADCTPYPNADVELVRHAWIRGIADYHFSIPGELDESIAAYLKVANGGNDSKLYAESLYKLAWSYYKRDRLRDSIQRFDDSVKLYDTIVATGATPALELREESIQYIAVAFTDPWEGEADSDPVKAFARAKEFYKGRENEPHVRDVWVAMGKAFTDLQAFDQAVDAYRLAIGPPWELNPANPLVHQEIVNVYELKGDKLAADSAAAELATRYACPASKWCQANEKDREAMENQRRIAERALYAAALNTHSAATTARLDYLNSKARDPNDKANYLALYDQAVQLYGQFITTYPESDYVYEFQFNEGEAMFWSEKYPGALVQYKWVRDHRDLGTAHYLDAATSVLATYEKLAEVEVAAGRLQPLKVPTSDELKALPQPLQPQPIPQVYVDLQGEYDNYQNVVQDPKNAPQQGINAALISLAYLHTDDAIKRFTVVMDKFCHVGPPDPKDKKSVAPAAKAKDGMLAIYLATGNLDAVETTNKLFIHNACGDQASIDLAVSQNRSLNFTRAAKLFADKQFIPAGDAFYRFYKTAPNTDPDLPTALYDAAVAYKQGDRPKTAIALFKEFNANPAKNFRESPYYLDAIRLTAASYQAAFDYTNAAKMYLELYDTTKKAQRLGIKPPPPIGDAPALTLDQIGLDALYNAAFVSELNRDFKQSLELYTKYLAIEKDRRKADRVTLEMSGIYRQQGDVTSMTETLDKWRARYGKDAGNEDDFVQSHYDTAALWKKKGNTAKAAAEGQAAIDGWKSHGATKNSRGAKLAGEYALALEEAAYAKWDAFQIMTAAGNVAQIKSIAKTLGDKKTAMEDEILKLDPYGVADLSMAAKLRFGDVQFTYALKLGAMPPPTFLKTQASQNIYQAQLDGNVKKYSEEAKKQWTEVVTAAKTGGISNKWSRLALEELGREFPGEFTPLRQELIQGTDTP